MRVYEWLGIYVVASSREEAMGCIARGYTGEAYTLLDAAENRRGRQDFGLDLAEYCRAVDPGEVIEIPEYAMPAPAPAYSLDTTGVVAEISVAFIATAETWAGHIPAGATWEET